MPETKKTIPAFYEKLIDTAKLRRRNAACRLADSHTCDTVCLSYGALIRRSSARIFILRACVQGILSIEGQSTQRIVARLSFSSVQILSVGGSSPSCWGKPHFSVCAKKKTLATAVDPVFLLEIPINKHAKRTKETNKITVVPHRVRSESLEKR